MGGTGSGRSGGYPTVEGCSSYSLTLKQLSHTLAECLQRKGRFDVSYRWHDGFTATLEFDLSCPADSFMRLTHETHRMDDNVEMTYTVNLQRTFPRHGGFRWWFTCPKTGRRCAKLYLPFGGSRFLSRESYRLRYRSQRETKVDRAWRIKRKIVRRLGGPADDWAGDLPDKPKWMRWSTYNRLADRWWVAEDSLDASTLLAVQRLMAR
jgi:hypothetical protein